MRARLRVVAGRQGYPAAVAADEVDRHRLGQLLVDVAYCTVTREHPPNKGALVRRPEGGWTDLSFEYSAFVIPARARDTARR